MLMTGGYMLFIAGIGKVALKSEPMRDMFSLIALI